MSSASDNLIIQVKETNVIAVFRWYIRKNGLIKSGLTGYKQGIGLRSTHFGTQCFEQLFLVI